MTGNNVKSASLVSVEQALKCKLPTDSKRILSQRRLEFLEDFGSDLTRYNVFFFFLVSPPTRHVLVFLDDQQSSVYLFITVNVVFYVFLGI